MMKMNIPKISKTDILNHFNISRNNLRKRSPKILHSNGDYVNKVFNFVLFDSYMQPHQHPGLEKIEKMQLVQGSFALIYFDDNGKIINVYTLEESRRIFISVPAFTWHTYVMLSNEVIVYEEMDGYYNPKTWKKMAPWAPKENTYEAKKYLQNLRNEINVRKKQIIP